MMKHMILAIVALGATLFFGYEADAHGKTVVTVDTAGLNVRQTPSTELQRVGLVYMGMEFDYLDREGDWVLIDYEGEARWVHGAYVKIDNKPIIFRTPELQPVKKVVKKVSATPKEEGQEVVMNVSAYTAKCLGCIGITANGYDVRNTVYKDGLRIVAAPSSYPFGTIMDIPGFGKAIVLDRGGAIKGNKLDLLVATRDEAIQWGRRNVTVTVY